MARKSKKSSQNKRGGGGGKRCIPRGPCSIQQRSCSKDLDLDNSGVYRSIVSFLIDTLCLCLAIVLALVIVPVVGLWRLARGIISRLFYLLGYLICLFGIFVCTVIVRAKDSFSNRTDERLPLDDAMNIFEEGMELLRGGNKLEQALEIKARRDKSVEKMKMLTAKDLHEAHLMTAKLTLQMAQCGLVEDETHSSITYAEDHAVMLFPDGGEHFFKMWKEAVDRAAWDKTKRKEMKRMISDGNVDGQMLIFKELLNAMDKDKVLNAQYESHFHNTEFDDELFQPCPPKPDCPICFLPMPRMNECCYQPCCGKSLCDGCIFAHRDAMDDLGMENSCPFCRDPIATSKMERLKKTMKRLEHGDSDAFYMIGAYYFEGKPPLKQNRKKGLEMINKAAELGLQMAHHSLGVAYAAGVGVEKNEKKALHHLRLAAIGGILESRHFLGQATRRGDPKLAYKHFLIAAEAGHDESLKEVKTGYAEGHVERDAFEKALRAHNAAKNEVSSEPREKAAEWYRRPGWLRLLSGG